MRVGTAKGEPHHQNDGGYPAPAAIRDGSPEPEGLRSHGSLDIVPGRPHSRKERALPARIEDYALLGDCASAALVARDGSVDWLCWPRFDSPACFAALLGTEAHGRWRIGPVGERMRITRSYRGASLVLDTTFETAEGAMTLTDFLDTGGGAPALVRIATGLRGVVRLRSELSPRFSYGASAPWIAHPGSDAWTLTAGPDMLTLRSDAPGHAIDGSVVAERELAAGEQVVFVLAHAASFTRPAAPIDATAALARTEAFWRAWSARCTCGDPYRDAVVRSLLTLKALTHRATGGIVAAPTTSLPQMLGGLRNWDYRYCWLRDATLTLLALMGGGYADEAAAWRDWLLRAVAGDPAQIQIMYGLAGERLLVETELPWLPGYEGAAPVRIGNAAFAQVQHDAFGQVLDALFQARRLGLPEHADAWPLERALVERLEQVWSAPDHGIWEVRGPPRHFTHSKVMCWVAVDRAIASAELADLPAPLPRWRTLRARIHDDVCAHGYSAERGTFVMHYGSQALDSALLLLPIVGFLPRDDARIRRTVDAIERELLVDGLLVRYGPEVDDGLPPGQGAFLACTFWLVEALALLGQRERAGVHLDRLLALRNDVGLLSEQYDVGARRLTGNFPQAFSHVGLVAAALRLG